MVIVVPPQAGPFVGSIRSSTVATYSACIPDAEKSLPFQLSSTGTKPQVPAGALHDTVVLPEMLARTMFAPILQTALFAAQALRSSGSRLRASTETVVPPSLDSFVSDSVMISISSW